MRAIPTSTAPNGTSAAAAVAAGVSRGSSSSVVPRTQVAVNHSELSASAPHIVIGGDSASSGPLGLPTTPSMRSPAAGDTPMCAVLQYSMPTMGFGCGGKFGQQHGSPIFAGGGRIGTNTDGSTSAASPLVLIRPSTSASVHSTPPPEQMGGHVPTSPGSPTTQRSGRFGLQGSAIPQSEYSDAEEEEDETRSVGPLHTRQPTGTNTAMFTSGNFATEDNDDVVSVSEAIVVLPNASRENNSSDGTPAGAFARAVAGGTDLPDNDGGEVESRTSADDRTPRSLLAGNSFTGAAEPSIGPSATAAALTPRKHGSPSYGSSYDDTLATAMSSPNATSRSFTTPT
jgi:hypothetical protein